MLDVFTAILAGELSIKEQMPLGTADIGMQGTEPVLLYNYDTLILLNNVFSNEFCHCQEYGIILAHTKLSCAWE